MTWPTGTRNSALLDRFPRQQVVVDGEIVALDATGRPSFSLLQQRIHVRSPSAGLLARVPVQLYVFDLLHLGARATLALPTPGAGRCSP